MQQQAMHLAGKPVLDLKSSISRTSQSVFSQVQFLMAS